MSCILVPTVSKIYATLGIEPSNSVLEAIKDAEASMGLSAAADGSKPLPDRAVALCEQLGIDPVTSATAPPPRKPPQVATPAPATGEFAPPEVPGLQTTLSAPTLNLPGLPAGMGEAAAAGAAAAAPPGVTSLPPRPAVPAAASKAAPGPKGGAMGTKADGLKATVAAAASKKRQPFGADGSVPATRIPGTSVPAQRGAAHCENQSQRGDRDARVEPPPLLEQLAVRQPRPLLQPREPQLSLPVIDHCFGAAQLFRHVGIGPPIVAQLYEPIQVNRILHRRATARMQVVQRAQAEQLGRGWHRRTLPLRLLFIEVLRFAVLIRSEVVLVPAVVTAVVKGCSGAARARVGRQCNREQQEDGQGWHAHSCWTAPAARLAAGVWEGDNDAADTPAFINGAHSTT